MNITNFFAIENIYLNTPIATYKALFLLIARQLSIQTQTPKVHIFKSLIQRELLGSTSFTAGYAMPTIVLDTIKEPIAILITFSKSPLIFMDGTPIKTAIGLALPKNHTNNFLILSVLKTLMEDARIHIIISQSDNAIDLLKNLNFSFTQM